MNSIITNLEIIKELAEENEAENDAFQTFIKQLDNAHVDKMVHSLNEQVSKSIDCTQCGNCCRSLMINVTQVETEQLAGHLHIPLPSFKENFIEESLGGVLIINQIPCHFLAGNSCTIYENRFTECRDFPHLHKPNFTARFFSTLMYYPMCPIIFNVVEQLKEKLGFKIVTPSTVEETA